MEKVLLTAPEGATTISCNGESYEVMDGMVEVPREDVHYFYAVGCGNAVVTINAKSKKPKDE